MTETQETSRSFTAQVVEAMEKLYPLALADKRWDNVGLLLDNFPLENEKQQPIVLLANDLTACVCEEAIEKRASVVIAYHPFIFRGLKSITGQDTQQSSLLRLARHGIAVYSPHTAVDAAPGGINDWLADACLGHNLKIATSAPSSVLVVSMAEKSRSVLQPVPTTPLPEGFEASTTGYGRKVVLQSPEFVSSILVNLKQLLNVEFGNVAFRQPDTLKEVMGRKVTSFAVCAGSGADVFGDCDADVLVTGELSHHAALRFVERGQVCVMLMHSSSERGFLRDRMAPRLQETLEEMGVRDVEVRVSEKDGEIFHAWREE